MEKYWNLCPIVGEVKDYVVRILCEPKIKEKLHYTIYDTVYKSIVPGEENNLVQPEIIGPTMIDIKVSYEGTYEIVWSNENICLYKQIICISEQPKKLLLVSCNMYEADVKKSMWKEIEKEIENERNCYLIHMGDQVYMDKEFKSCKNYIKKNQENLDENKIYNMLSKRYFKTWTPCSKVLSSVPNYMFLGDHEIVNNIKLYLEHSDPHFGPTTKYLLEVYKWYQENLNIEIERILNDYSWVKVFGYEKNYVMFGIENCSSFLNVDDVATVISHYIYPHVTKLFICFSCAPIPSPQGINGGIYEILTDNKKKLLTGDSKFWSHSDLTKLYSYLLYLRMYYPQLDIVVFGGDVHFGLHATVSAGPNQFQVVVSSPITNNPTFDRTLASSGLKGEQIVGKTHDNHDIIFNTISTKPRRCYASVDISQTPAEIFMNYSNSVLPKNPLKYLRKLIQMK